MKVLFLAPTKGGERVRRTRERVSKQTGVRERRGENHYFFVCRSSWRLWAEAGSGGISREEERRQKRTSETPGSRRPFSVMRPRSRLLAKRGLPTIREGYEELVQDLNQTNSQHTTTQDYFLSICHLARPTFPLHEPDYDILSIGPLDSPKPCLRLHRLRQHLQPPQAHTSAVQQAQKETEIKCAPSEPMQPQVSEEDNGCRSDGPGPTDPLEYLYSHRGALASSTTRGSIPSRRPRCDTFPCLSSAPDTQRKSSCPELCLAEAVTAATVTATTVLQRSPLNRKKLDAGSLAARSGVPNKLDGTPAGWRGKSSHCMDKQTIVSHWIAECRSTWKEARIRACMLPAIAEK